MLIPLGMELSMDFVPLGVANFDADKALGAMPAAMVSGKVLI